MWPAFKTERPFEPLVSLEGDMRLSTLAFGFTVSIIGKYQPQVSHIHVVWFPSSGSAISLFGMRLNRLGGLDVGAYI